MVYDKKKYLKYMYIYIPQTTEKKNKYICIKSNNYMLRKPKTGSMNGKTY